MARLIHTGSVIVDQVMHIREVPEPGADIVATHAYATAGGAMNSLVAAAKDGMEVIYCGLVGTGMNASVIAQALDNAGIALNYPRLTDADNGYCVALVDDTGERTFITSIGVEGRFAFEHMDAIPLRETDLVYVSGYSLATPENAQGLAQWLPIIPASVKVFVDPSPLVTELPAELYQPLLDRADVFSANRREAEAIAEDVKALALMLRPGAWAVVRNGAEPTLACQNIDGIAGEVIEVPTFPQTPIDTNGAGDVHAGVMLAGLGRGLDVPEAVRRANAASAIKVTRSGPTAAPTTAEIDEFLAARVTA
ncbi:MAG: sugar kinase [Actinomycetaceae bacterium]|nr:sugar kinase [Actinomycetaceae bacterium]